MNCREFRKLVPELEGGARQGSAMEHIRECVSCAAIWERNQTLRAGLRQMACQQREFAAPARVEAALIDAFRRQAEAPQKMERRRLGFLPVPAGILAASTLAAALAAFLLWNHPPRRGTTSVPGVVAEAEDTPALDGDFIPLPYFGNSSLLSASPAEADLVRVEIPRSTLVALGVAVPEENAPEAVQAELLLGAGGMPQAVRVLQ